MFLVACRDRFDLCEFVTRFNIPVMTEYVPIAFSSFWPERLDRRTDGVATGTYRSPFGALMSCRSLCSRPAGYRWPQLTNAVEEHPFFFENKPMHKA